jgi:hypothetical protein
MLITPELTDWGVDTFLRVAPKLEASHPRYRYSHFKKRNYLNECKQLGNSRGLC